MALATKFGIGIPSGMLLAGGSAGNAVSSTYHEVWRRDPCRDTTGWRRHRQRRCPPLSPSLVEEFLLRYCWQAAAQALLVVAPVTKFDGGLPTGILRALGGAYNIIGGPGHQVWRWSSSLDISDWGQSIQRCWPPLSLHLAVRSLLGCRGLVVAQTTWSVAIAIMLTTGSLLGCCWPVVA